MKNNEINNLILVDLDVSHDLNIYLIDKSNISIVNGTVERVFRLESKT